MLLEPVAEGHLLGGDVFEHPASEFTLGRFTGFLPPPRAGLVVLKGRIEGNRPDQREIEGLSVDVDIVDPAAAAEAAVGDPDRQVRNLINDLVVEGNHVDRKRLLLAAVVDANHLQFRIEFVILGGGENLLRDTREFHPAGPDLFEKPEDAEPRQPERHRPADHDPAPAAAGHHHHGDQRDDQHDPDQHDVGPHEVGEVHLPG